MQVGNQSRAVTSCVLPASSFFSHRLMLSRKQLELRTNSLCIGWSVKRRLRNIHIELLFFFVLHSAPLVCTPLHLSRHSLPCNKSLYTLKYIKPTVLCNINTIAFIICIHIEIKTNASCLCWVVWWWVHYAARLYGRRRCRSRAKRYFCCRHGGGIEINYNSCSLAANTSTKHVNAMIGALESLKYWINCCNSWS